MFITSLSPMPETLTQHLRQVAAAAQARLLQLVPRLRRVRLPDASGWL